ncbi:MAG: extracellular solute-binding protein [Oscillospiraceae bacterium]|nr:extracellular solute-binding protein [Oscillospiraceae bacterium]MBR2889998.1 extracellular solute-binding protein [Oscillospiraceae bacterium]
MKKITALLLVLVMVLGLVACGEKTPETTKPQTGNNGETTPVVEPSNEPDTIVIMAPPVTGEYLNNLKVWAADFNKLYPHLTVEIIETSWGDHSDKLSTMAQAGEAPDIAEISSGALGTYVEMGVAIDIAKYMSADRLADYDANAVEYMSLEGTTYGLPLYLTIQSIGANKTLMEELGIDVAKIQNEGWTYEEFLDVIAKGTDGNRFGFVFANAGVTASDMLNIFGAGVGLSNNFTADLKYTFTSENMLTLLTAIEEMTKSGYMPNYGVEAGQRMVMCQTGNAMIFGKAMPLFESNFNKNNAALEANDGTAVENSLPMEYAFLPVPTMMGCAESCYGTVDGLIAMRNKNTTDEHLANVLLFMDYICSGDRIASCMNELYLDPVCQSGRDALVLQEGRDEQNLATAGRCIAMVEAPPAGVTAEMTATAKKMMDEHIVPKFQLLLAGEATAQEVYEYICEAAYDAFGAENCVSGKIG